VVVQVVPKPQKTGSVPVARSKISIQNGVGPTSTLAFAVMVVV
jgi:hypothetical protein